MSHYMTLFIAPLHFILYNWRWMMVHPKHVLIKLIIWTSKTSLIGLLRPYLLFAFTVDFTEKIIRRCTCTYITWTIRFITTPNSIWQTFSHPGAKYVKSVIAVKSYFVGISCLLSSGRAISWSSKLTTIFSYG